jgi:hypothetical protein
MAGYSFGKINLPGPAGTYVFISVNGVDAAGEAIGNYGDSDGNFHGFTANSGTPVIFDPPGSSNTNLGGITDSGEIFGNYTNQFNQQVGFTYSDGTFTTINATLANTTTVFGVTSDGTVFGGYVDILGGSHGFLDSNGVFTEIDAPGAVSTTVMGVSALGEIAGTIVDSSDIIHGFVDSNGIFTTIDPPGSIATYVVGVGAAGTIAGVYYDNANNEHGFVDNNGAISTIAVAGATSTAVTGVNASGEVVGNFIDKAGNVNGFVDDNGLVTTVDVPGASQTDILGITDAGDIYGYYNDGSGQHGFVGTTNGNSVFSASGGQNIINGIGGHDTIVFDGPRAEYTLTVNSDGSLSVVDNGSSGDGTNQLLNVEHLQFTDQTVFAETPDNANIARLYSAAFNRLPDTAGLNFWEDVYANSISAAVKSQGYYVSLAETNDGSGISIAANFIASPEFQADYGTLSDVGFVTAMYENVLGRTPDQAGLNFWVGQLEGGAQPRAVVLVGFAESPENVAKTAPWLITT